MIPRLIIRNYNNPHIYPRLSRFYSQKRPDLYKKNMTQMYYAGSVLVLFIGLSYAAVPLYQLICTTTGFDGTPMIAKENHEDVRPVKGARPIQITFSADVGDTMKYFYILTYSIDGSLSPLLENCTLCLERLRLVSLRRLMTRTRILLGYLRTV
jgi:hypothetical protein